MHFYCVVQYIVCCIFVYRRVASVSDGNLTGRQGQLIAAMTQDSKTDYTKEAKLLLRAVEVFSD